MANYTGKWHPPAGLDWCIRAAIGAPLPLPTQPRAPPRRRAAIFITRSCFALPAPGLYRATKLHPRLRSLHVEAECLLAGQLVAQQVGGRQRPQLPQLRRDGAGERRAECSTGWCTSSLQAVWPNSAGMALASWLRTVVY
jgi:hypothetical protein